MNARRRVGVIGGGWAGLAAAVELSRAGWAVHLWEMAPVAGGRGRSGVHHALPDGATLELDAGQHILIGAYTESLRLMQAVGVDLKAALWRGPLQLVDGHGAGLKLPPGPPIRAFLRGLMAHRAWSVRDRLRLLVQLGLWHHRGFRCPPGLTVAGLCRGLPAPIMAELIEPLCVAALNTPAPCADATVFLRVLRDGLFAGPGGSDLLIPRTPLQALWPQPAVAHLQAAQAQVELGHRVQAIEPVGQGRWQVRLAHAMHTVDRLVVAASATEAARLLQPWDADWSDSTRQLPFEPIVTTWVQAPGLRLGCPMVRLDQGPAQFAFDLQALGWPWPGGVTLVSSDAGIWLDQGMAALEAAVLQQVRRLPGVQAEAATVVRSIAERRATFRCEPTIRRPPAQAARSHGGLWVAADYVEGPYPSTLEGAVRAGVAAAHHVNNS